MSEEQNNERLSLEVNSSEQNSSERESNEYPGDTPEVEVYNWTDTQGNESIIPETKTEKNSWNNMKFILSYPYSLRSFYTVNESVKLSYDGPEALGQQSVDIYLIKEHSPSSPKNEISSGMNESTINLEDVLNNDTETYVKIPATLNKEGNLTPLTLDPLQAGYYWILITRAGNETVKAESEKEIYLAKYFEVLEYQMEARAPDALQEGKNLEVNMDLKNAPAEKNYTYWAVMIKDSAY
ncbi:MAG TPA: TIGR04279 domain-containing protein, partial [Methanosarcina sp.]|nr:TIGR04279 domain-containing protein [Methanosarcina sp.]